MDKILFLKEADRMAASETNAGTREYVYKKAAPVTGTKPKRDEVGFFVPYAMFRPSKCRACSVSCWAITRCAAVQTSK